MLNTHIYGPDTVDAEGEAPPTLLAIHGITGHGARWRGFSDAELPGVRVLAPDLRGHARSTWTPPWSFETLVADLVSVLERHRVSEENPAVVIGHSMGGALACRLAEHRPDLVRGLLLLDPAQQIDPELALTLAEQTAEHFDFSSPQEARDEKTNGAWQSVPSEVLDTEIAEHLVRRDSGRWEWNVSRAAIVGLWGELARDAVGAPPTIPTILLRATRADYVTPAQLAAMPDTVEIVDVDSDHMVPQEIPGIVGEYARRLLG